ncbi:MAG: HAD-IA family hydrolase [Sulfurifustis sp.]
MKMSGYRVLSFDCYGTLVDWEAGIIEAFRALVAPHDIILSDLAILNAFLDIETNVVKNAPSKTYQEVLFEVYREFAQQHGIHFDESGAVRFASSIGHWPLFPDTQRSLDFLSQHHKLVILSNIDDASIERTRSQIKVRFLDVYTAQQIGSYKPDPRNFRYLLGRLAEYGYAKEQLLHVSVSLFHDLIPAQALGIDTCWINRGNSINGTLATPPGFQAGIEPTYTYRSLQELLDNYE